jgi:ACT domain-containing protein
MTMLVDTSTSTVPYENLSDALHTKGKDMGLNIRIQREDIFNAMHKI